MKSIFLSILVSLFSLNALALNCHGTEPFWSADLSTDKIVFDNFGDVETFPVSEIDSAFGYTASFLQIYKNNRGPVAIVTTNKCSDGMSDFEYPNEIILFTGTGTFYGCCGVGVPLNL